MKPQVIFLCAKKNYHVSYVLICIVVCITSTEKRSHCSFMASFLLLLLHQQRHFNLFNLVYEIAICTAHTQSYIVCFIVCKVTFSLALALDVWSFKTIGTRHFINSLAICFTYPKDIHSQNYTIKILIQQFCLFVFFCVEMNFTISFCPQHYLFECWMFFFSVEYGWILHRAHFNMKR